MDFKQKTIDDLIESEHLMLSIAPQRYGAYYSIALDLSVTSPHLGAWSF
jgi:hypothetical protein